MLLQSGGCVSRPFQPEVNLAEAQALYLHLEALTFSAGEDVRVAACLSLALHDRGSTANEMF